jgi:hypothetical protein
MPKKTVVQIVRVPRADEPMWLEVRGRLETAGVPFGRYLMGLVRSEHGERYLREVCGQRDQRGLRDGGPAPERQVDVVSGERLADGLPRLDPAHASRAGVPGVGGGHRVGNGMAQNGRA